MKGEPDWHLLLQNPITRLANKLGARKKKTLQQGSPRGLYGRVSPVRMTRGKTGLCDVMLKGGPWRINHPDVYEVVYHAKLSGGLNKNLTLSLNHRQATDLPGHLVRITDYNVIHHLLHSLYWRLRGYPGLSSVEVYPVSWEDYTKGEEEVDA